MDQLQVLKLPSMAKFNAGFLKCNHSFEEVCVGPAKASYELRMMKVRLHILLLNSLYYKFQVHLRGLLAWLCNQGVMLLVAACTPL